MTNEQVHPFETTPARDEAEELIAEFPDRLWPVPAGQAATVAPPTPPPGTTRDDQIASRHDEWGIYDPDRAGLPAILARIGAAAASDEDAVRRRQAQLLRLTLDEDD